MNVAARIHVKVHPRAKRTQLAGKLGDAYKIDVASPAVEGKANEACIRFLADLTGRPRSAVRIVAGAASRLKIVEIEGIDQISLERVLNG